MDTPEPRLLRRLQGTLLAFFLPFCAVAGDSVCRCAIHLHEHALPQTLSSRALPRSRNTLAGWGRRVARLLADRRPAPLALGVLACAGGLRRDDPRCSRHNLAADGGPASHVPTLVQSVSDGCRPDRDRHCRVDAPHLSASWSVGHGKTGQSQDKTPTVTR